MVARTAFIEVEAFEIMQSPGRRLYSFVIDGKKIPSFASVSRVRRVETDLLGYQRPEVVSHIDEIRTYLEGESPMIPNSVVIAFDERVKFTASARAGAWCRLGKLTIPTSGEEKPGFVVDGQQRLAAIRDADIRQFPMPVTAFITDDLEVQTEQFILVNSTKPLPRGLIHELLPHTSAVLPPRFHRRRLPAMLVDRLNHDPASPLFGLIATPTAPRGVIKDNSMLRMLENSLTDGSLYEFRKRGETPDIDGMVAVLTEFWSAVRDSFSDAWALPPRKSRLMHGAGIVALGQVMDQLSAGVQRRRLKRGHFGEALDRIRPKCAWTAGYWRIPPRTKRRWDEIQNTTQDVQLLARALIAFLSEREAD